MIKTLVFFLGAMLLAFVEFVGRVWRKISRRVRRWLGLVLAVVVLAGCPLPPPDGCTPAATRCSPAGVPQTCSQTQRWTSGSLAKPCAELGATCCLARSPWGRSVHACVPSSVCLPEIQAADGGAE